MKVSSMSFYIHISHYVIVKKDSDLTLKNAIKPLYTETIGYIYLSNLGKI